MGTSKSNDVWTGGALLYSGRRNPTWRVSPSVVRKLQKLWKAMPPVPQLEPSPTGLGYRGTFLRGPRDRKWIAFKGIVSLKTPSGIEVRSDDAREFEKALLASAPAGLLPPKGFKDE
jgi:hypothetical protein